MSKLIGLVWLLQGHRKWMILYALRPLENAHDDLTEQAAFAICTSQKQVEAFLESCVGVGLDEDGYRAYVRRQYDVLSLPLEDDDRAHVLIDSTMANVLGVLMTKKILKKELSRDGDRFHDVEIREGFVSMLTQRPNVSPAHRRDALMIVCDRDVICMAVCYAKDQLRVWAEQYAMGRTKTEIMKDIDRADLPETSERSCVLIGPPENNGLADPLARVLIHSNYSWSCNGKRDRRYRISAITYTRK